MFVCYQYDKNGLITSEVISETPPKVENQLVARADEIFESVITETPIVTARGTELRGRIQTRKRIELGGKYFHNGRILDEQRRPILGLEVFTKRMQERNQRILAIKDDPRDARFKKERDRIRAQETGERQERINELVRQGVDIHFVEPEPKRKKGKGSG